jgi:hypothetical protein
MARNGSGTYSVPNTFVSGNTITASGHNQNFSDMGTEITNSVAADGQTSMTGALKAANGTVGAPAVSFASDTDSGFYRKAANSIAMALEGADKIVYTTAAASFACGLIASATATFILAPVVPAKSFAITKIADGTANRLYGTDGSGVATEVTIGNGLTLSASSLSSTAQLGRGYIDGMILSNGTDATNDINIAAGTCRDSTDTVNIVIATALGKQLDANWTAGGTTGTPVGGRNSAAGIANGTYHWYAVRTAASSAGDVYAYAGAAGTDPDSSASIATMLAALQAETGGASYAYARRIGSTTRASAAILAFSQNGDEFLLNTPLNAFSAAIGSTSAVLTTVTGVPLGPKVRAMLSGNVNYATTGADQYFWISSPDQTDAAPDSVNHTVRSTSVPVGFFLPGVRTNTSGQIRRRSTAAGASDNLQLNCYGYIDRRGKDN